MKKVGKTARSFRYDLNQIPYDSTVEVRTRFKGLDLIDRVLDVLGASVRNSAHGKGHEEGGPAYAKAGSSLRRPPVPEHLPPKPESACFTVLCFPPTLLTLTGGCSPTTFFWKKLI